MPPKKIGSFEEIQQAKDLADAVTVDIPEWGFAVKIRGLTRGELKAITANGAEAEEVNAQALQLALVEPVLTLEQVREILRDKSVKATERLTEAVMDASGLAEGFRP